jgi:Transposase domain (DUF772)
MSDRQAVEMVKYHLGWKLALNLKLGDPGFHSTTLVYFRKRLLEHAKSDLAFLAVLDPLQAEGLIPKRFRQRLDSTHVLAAVADLSALECVREMLRLALNWGKSCRTVSIGFLGGNFSSGDPIHESPFLNFGRLMSLIWTFQPANR